jgi:hypothetical protein
MKKIKQRWGMVGLIALGAVLLYGSGVMLWGGITHVGPGVWRYGGEKYDGRTGAEEYEAVIPEHQYKRNCYAAGASLFLIGGLFLYEGIKRWKERNELEKSWERAISNANNVQAIRQHPELYQDDFRQWIQESHPSVLL